MSEIETKLQAPQTKGHVSVAELKDWWYVACTSAELKRGPMERTILGIPMVLFRDKKGKVGALLDRCPHRNVPLSLGEVTKTGELQCAYHGWCFDTQGSCTKVPCLVGDPDSKGRQVPNYPVREQDGYVWVYANPDTDPVREPFRLPKVSGKYTRVDQSFEVDGSVHAVAENALDVPHTAYLHAGLFRGAGTPNRIKARLERWEDWVECEYIGEPRPEGVVGKMLSPSGGIVEHWDRFFLPSIAQVEYKLGTENHILVNSMITPVTDFVTRLYATIQFKVRVPGWMLEPVVKPLAMRIFQQDADILKIQTEHIRRFGGEQYVSTDLDLIGPHIWRLLRQAERGDPGPAEYPVVKEIELDV